jgi:serine protease Do
LAQYIEPSVVKIESKGSGGTDVLGRRMGEETGIGTGVIFRPDGWIITNDHVVAGFSNIMVDLSDGRQLPAKVVREASDNDLAVVKVDAKDLPAAQFGDSASVRPGQFAMAVGAPFDMQNTVTVGHISALGRDQSIPDERSPIGVRAYSDLIQTDTPINMGNSGGPLINVDGQVIGINSAILSRTGGSVGIGFAIPSNQANMIAQELIQKGSVTTAFLGLAPGNVPEYIKREKNIEGGAVVLDQPTNAGPAAAAGIQKNDIITRVGNFPIRNEQDVRDSMFHYAPGSTVQVEVLRGTEHKTFNVKLQDKKDWDEQLAKKYKSLSAAPEDGMEGQPFQFPMPKGFDSIPFPQTPQTAPKGENQQPHTGPVRLGVGVEDLNDSTRSDFGIPAGVQGAVVTSVAPGSFAEGLGIAPGCVIQQVGDKKIRTAQDLRDAMAAVHWGDTKSISFGKYSSGSVMNMSSTVTFK